MHMFHIEYEGVLICKYNEKKGHFGEYIHSEEKKIPNRLCITSNDWKATRERSIIL